MSYSDAHQARSAKPIVAVAALHAIIAYGFISGLAYDVIPFVEPPLSVRQIRDDMPPPPKTPPPPERRTVVRTTVGAPDAVIRRPDLGKVDIVVVSTIGSDEVAKPDLQPVLPKAPVHPSQARGATVMGNRAAWVTADDYPPAAVREGAEGSVGISVTIGIDGRVSACEVTSTNGNAVLDQQTCRTYTRRARFTPALDDEGHPTIAHRTDRVRWQLPAQ